MTIFSPEDLQKSVSPSVSASVTFSAKVEGTLAGVSLNLDILGPIIEILVTIATAPIKQVFIYLAETWAEIEIAYTQIRQKVRIKKMEVSATEYSKGLLRAEGMYWFDDEMKQYYKDTLKEDFKNQMRKMMSY